MEQAIKKILTADFCPCCKLLAEKSNVMRLDAVLSSGKCCVCGKDYKVIFRCRYTMSAKEMMRRGITP